MCALILQSPRFRTPNRQISLLQLSQGLPIARNLSRGGGTRLSGRVVIFIFVFFLQKERAMSMRLKLEIGEGALMLGCCCCEMMGNFLGHFKAFGTIKVVCNYRNFDIL